MKHSRLIKSTIVQRLWIGAEFYSNEDSEFCYIPILKNAHSWGVRFFSDVANFRLYQDVVDKKYIIFLRDPFERWVSGVAQYFAQQLIDHDTEYHMDEMMIKIILGAIRLDAHTDLQTKTLIGIPRFKSVYFNVDDSQFEVNVKHFVQSKMNLRFRKQEIGKFHAAEKSKLKIGIKHQILNFLQNEPKYKQQIIDYYQEDYNLISTVKFYQPGKN